MTAPVDQAARDEATTALDASIALAAGAGSGKTTVLTARVLGLLLAGRDPARVAAITFTEKATAELLERVRDKLEAHALAHPDDVNATAALARFGELRVSTIHSFCRLLLTLEALASRWAPETEMVDAALVTAPLRGAWSAWRRGFDARQPTAAVLVRLLTWEGTLRTGGDALVTFRDLVPHRAAAFDPGAAHRQIVALAAAMQAARGGCRFPDHDKLVASNASLATALARAASADAADAIAIVLIDAPNGKLTGGKKTDWHPGGKDAFLDVIRAFRALRTELLAGLHGLVVADLAEHYLPLVADAKAESALADHDDLLFRARDLLLHRPDARARLASAFDAVLIDEVQDTDPIQAEVAALLGRDAAAAGPWHTGTPEPGRLFAVGDPRQSIYRFRRADVAVWQRLVGLIERGGSALSLTQNFRSVPGIVAWVNHTFSDLAGHEPQTAWRGPAALDPIVALPIVLPDGSEGLNIRDAQALAGPLERDAIVRHLLDLRGRNVFDPELERNRPLEWRDVMVLSPVWRSAHELAADLVSAGIPALVEGGRTFYSRPEVRVALDALRALVEPGDSEAVVATLRELFGLTLADLARHLHDGGAFRYTVREQPTGPVSAALGVLRGLNRARGRSTLVALLDALLDAARTRAVWALLPDGEARLANLDRFEARVREAETLARHPAEVVELLQAEAKDAEEQEQSRGDTDLDAVRLTTVFSAKGLEAPVVVLAGNRRSASSVSVARDPAGERVAVKIGQLAPPDWELWKEAEKAALEEERHRWMYVACTRARDQLVIPVFPTQAAGSTDLTHRFLLAGLHRVTEADHDDVLPIADDVTVRVLHRDQLPPPDLQQGPFAALTPTVEAALTRDPIDDVEASAWSDRHVQGRARAKDASVRWKRVTELAHVDATQPGSGTGIGVEGGELVHEVLDHLDLGAADRLTAARTVLSALAAERGASDDLVDSVDSALRRILANPVFDEIAAAPEVWREVPFGIAVDGQQVHGVIDCTYPLDEARRTWRVIDWKSDLPAIGSPARRNYERQVALYAKAVLQTVGPCETVLPTLVGPHPELGVPDPRADAVAAVREELVGVLERLLDAGAAVPWVRAEVEGVVCELAFEAEKVALVLDGGEIAGWSVVRRETGEIGWERGVFEEVFEGLGGGR